MIWLLLLLAGAREVDTLIGSLQERRIAFVHFEYNSQFKSIAGHVPYSVRQPAVWDRRLC
jgi:hypothetical protein